jgi:hypothetical protein
MKTGFCRWLIARKGFLFPYTSMSVRGQSGTAVTLPDGVSPMDWAGPGTDPLQKMGLTVK